MSECVCNRMRTCLSRPMHCPAGEILFPGTEAFTFPDRVGVDNDPTRNIASDRFCSLHGASGPAQYAAASPASLAPLGDVLQRIPLHPTVAPNATVSAAAVFVLQPKAVAPAILQPMGADLKLPSPPPGPRAGTGGNVLTASGFRARRQTATAAVTAKPVRPPVAPADDGSGNYRRSSQQDIRGFLVRP